MPTGGTGAGKENLRTAGTKAAHPNWPSGPSSGRSLSGKIHMRIPIIVLACGLATAAQAQEQGTVLDRAAGLVGQCIAEQTGAELRKATAPRQFETVLRDKCRSQEQRFRATLTAGLKKEGSLDAKMLRIV